MSLHSTYNEKELNLQPTGVGQRRHCSGPHFIGETEAAIFFETRWRTRWFVSASGAAYEPRLSPRQRLFSKCSGRNRRTRKPAFWRQRNIGPFSRAYEPLPLSGWTGTSFEAPVRREWLSRRGAFSAQPLFCDRVTISYSSALDVVLQGHCFTLGIIDTALDEVTDRHEADATSILDNR